MYYIKFRNVFSYIRRFTLINETFLHNLRGIKLNIIQDFLNQFTNLASFITSGFSFCFPFELWYEQYPHPPFSLVADFYLYAQK